MVLALDGVNMAALAAAVGVGVVPSDASKEGVDAVAVSAAGEPTSVI